MNIDNNSAHLINCLITACDRMGIVPICSSIPSRKGMKCTFTKHCGGAESRLLCMGTVC